MSRASSLSRRDFFRGQLQNNKTADVGWHHVEGLSAGSGDVFWGGWADDEGVFVVGDDGAIFHFDGVNWLRMKVPAPVPVHALWGRSREELYAVGWMGLILRYDGQNWEMMRGCSVTQEGKYSGEAENTPLFDISGRADGQAWAVGDNGTILHFDGTGSEQTGWTVEKANTQAHLRSVLCLEDGRVLAAGGDGTVLVRDMEGQWAALECPVGSNFVAALELDKDTFLLAGGRYFIDVNGFRGDLILYHDGEFRKLFQGAPFRRFRDMTRTDKGIVTVGDGGQIFLIHDDQFDQIESGTTHDLLGIVPLPSGEAVVVGDFGMVLAGNEQTLSTFAPNIMTGDAASVWQEMSSGTDRQLWGAWSDPVSQDLYACGEEGTVLRLDRGQWEPLPPVGDVCIHALQRAPDGGLLAAGQLGEIHHYDGSVWRKHFDLLMDVTILSMWSDGADGAFAAGDEGLVLQWNGKDWTRMPSGTKSALYGMWGRDASHLLAVGDFGLILRWNGERWDTFNAGTENFLFDVWGRSLNDIYVVGLSGTIGHFDGRMWRMTPARARNDLLAVVGSGEVIVTVGAGGVALIHDGETWKLDPTGCNSGLRAISAGADGDFFAVGDGGKILKRPTRFPS